jgi:hypothetical protein
VKNWRRADAQGIANPDPENLLIKERKIPDVSLDNEREVKGQRA